MFKSAQHRPVGTDRLQHSDTTALLMAAFSYPPPGLTPGPCFDESTLRIVIVDALALSRDALRVVLAAEGGLSVVGAACDGAEAVGFVCAHRPHVLLLDVAMPRVGGLDALRHVMASGTSVPTVILADAMTGIEVVDALTLGARGVLLKDAFPPVLYECVRAVADGAYWIGNERVRDGVDALRRVREEALPASAGARTPRELQVIAAIMDGATNREIGLRLNVSVDTVKRLLREVFGQVGSLAASNSRCTPLGTSFTKPGTLHGRWDSVELPAEVCLRAPQEINDGQEQDDETCWTTQTATGLGSQ
jgi:DNA-binding NarL/FixJ family response regulator